MIFNSKSWKLKFKLFIISFEYTRRFRHKIIVYFPHLISCFTLEYLYFEFDTKCFREVLTVMLTDTTIWSEYRNSFCINTITNGCGDWKQKYYEDAITAWSKNKHYLCKIWAYFIRKYSTIIEASSDILHLLMTHGPKQPQEELDSLLLDIDNANDSWNIDIFKVLLFHGPNINAAERRRGYTLLHIAAFYSSFEFHLPRPTPIKFLLDEGASTNVSRRGTVSELVYNIWVIEIETCYRHVIDETK